MKTSNEFRIYVGTYAKYNDGSLFGKWIDLSDYNDLEEFYKACLKLHQDEEDGSGHRPELMFQDWEYIPDFLISESSLPNDTFTYMEAISEMDEDRANAFEIYCKDIASWPDGGKELEDQLESFDESYQGYFGGSMKDPEIEFAYQYIEDTGMLSETAETLQRYFDYEAFARDLFMDGYTQLEGHVFSTY